MSAGNLDPKTLAAAALHVRTDGARRLVSPLTIELECGCVLDV